MQKATEKMLEIERIIDLNPKQCKIQIIICWKEIKHEQNSIK
jgi:hypothetical protein